MTPLDYDFLRKLLKERSGLDLSADKQYLVESRLIPLARRAGLPGIAELVAKIKAGADKLTVNVAIVVPLLPSVTVTSFIERFGVATIVQLFTAEAVLRGDGPEIKKSAPLSLVSLQPPALLKSAVALLPLVNDAGPDPS